MSNRVEKIQAHSEVTWRQVGTSENPADLGSRGGGVTEHPSWCNEPKWLQNKACWPPDIVTKASDESMAEEKAMRDVFAVAIATTDELDTLLEKFTYWKTMRICEWIMRFVHNVRSRKIGRLKGPLTTEETNKAITFWVKRVQTRAAAHKHYQEDQLQLNLQPNQDGLLECRGRIQGHFPVFLLHGETRNTISSRNTPWGSCQYHGKDSRAALGSAPEAIDQENHETMNN